MKHISKRSHTLHSLSFGHAKRKLSFYSLFIVSFVFEYRTNHKILHIFYPHNKMHSLNKSFIEKEGDNNNYGALALHVTAYNTLNHVNPMYSWCIGTLYTVYGTLLHATYMWIAKYFSRISFRINIVKGLGNLFLARAKTFLSLFFFIQFSLCMCHLFESCNEMSHWTFLTGERIEK